MRIGSDAQLLCCFHLVVHISTLLIFYLNLIGQRFVLGVKHGILLCIPSFNCYNYKSKELFMSIFSPRNGSFPMSQDLRIIPF
jgi:hypothetical protein